MAEFTVNQPVVTEEPVIQVEGLQLGKHTFQLVVIDDEGNSSAPSEVVVSVVKRPTIRPIPIRVFPPVDQPHLPEIRRGGRRAKPGNPDRRQPD